MLRYASIGAVLMSKRVAQGIRGNSGIWKHGHTYQVRPGGERAPGERRVGSEFSGTD